METDNWEKEWERIKKLIAGDFELSGELLKSICYGAYVAGKLEGFVEAKKIMKGN